MRKDPYNHRSTSASSTSARTPAARSPTHSTPMSSLSTLAAPPIPQYPNSSRHGPPYPRSYTYVQPMQPRRPRRRRRKDMSNCIADLAVVYGVSGWPIPRDPFKGYPTSTGPSTSIRNNGSLPPSSIPTISRTPRAPPTSATSATSTTSTTSNTPATTTSARSSCQFCSFLSELGAGLKRRITGSRWKWKS
ncbi:hypothetical protein GYMLUDRAFT_239318 [Collybiopsis luxurians FD-317 M1]|nr:hypothetical protein GYMLUDRAFT_239318 [Collybiopsis luxurians FD-317 M1]